MEDLKGSKNVLAESHFREALRLRKETGELDAVLIELESAIDADGSVALFWLNKGQVLSELGQHVKAILAFKKMLSLEDHPLGWYLLGITFHDVEQFTESAEALSKARDAFGNDHNFLTLLASAQLTFDPDLAFATATEALKLNPIWDEAKSIRDSAQKLIQSVD